MSRPTNRTNPTNSLPPLSEQLDTPIDAGVSNPAEPKGLVVKMGDERFALRALDEMTPGQLIILRLLMPQRNLPLVIADENDVRVGKLVESVDKCLAIIAPELAARGIPFVKKLDVLDYYEDNTPGLIRQPKVKKGKGKGKGKATQPDAVSASA